LPNFIEIILMKRFLSILIAFGFSTIAIAQVPATFNYQTIVRKKTGEVIAAKKVSLKFSIVPDLEIDTIVYSERHVVTTDKSGFVSVTVGNGTEKTGSFSNIDWNVTNYFLRVEIDTTGGSAYSEIGPMQILNDPAAKKTRTLKKSEQGITEDKLFISRKYVGKFLDFRQTGPKDYNGPNLIWIKTNLEANYGKISAYGKKCAFSIGDNLYLRRGYYIPGGVSGFWVYQIENDASVYYRVTEFQHDRKVQVETWFK
jgi:hypothetical protein